MEEDYYYDYLGQYYDDWNEQPTTRDNEVDKRLVNINGYIDPRTYDSYDNTSINWLKVERQLDMEEAFEYEEDSNNHPTVGNINYNEMENLPYHERIWEKDGRKNYHYRYPQRLQKAIKIFKGSVGKNMSDIQKRLDPLLKAGKESFETFTGWHSGKGRNSWYRFYGVDYFVDENNILRSNIIVKPRRKQPLTWQQHYKLRQERRKKDKEKDERGLIDLSVINKPGLLSYVIKQSDRFNTLLYESKLAILYYDSYQESLKKDGKKKFWELFSYMEAEKNKPELERLKEQMTEFKLGNFQSFYDSNDYLFSIGKECPHFEKTKL